ncbi:MAG: hypothetical protein QW379_07145 [Thermoplasmata archaeon]
MLGPIKELKVRVLERDSIGMLNFSEKQEGFIQGVNACIYFGVRARDIFGNEEWVDASWSSERGDLVHITPRRSSQVRIVGLRPAEGRIPIIAEYAGHKARAYIEGIGGLGDGALRSSE